MSVLFKKKEFSFKQLYSILIISIAFSFSIGCQSSSQEGDREKSDDSLSGTKIEHQLAFAPQIDSLDVLFLENWPEAGHNQLEQLLLPTSKRIDKFVFEFIYKKGELSLIMYSCEKGNKKFDSTKQVLLTNLKRTKIGLNAFDKVILGSQQTLDKASTDAFINAKNREDSKYLIFTPEIKKLGDNQYHIIYNVVGVKSLTEQPLLKVPIADLNPSPPKDAY